MAGTTKTLAEKIEARTCRYGVVGLGYVGLPLAIAFAQRGIRVTGFEVDAEKASALLRGESYIPDVPASDVRAAVKAGTFEATTDFSRLAACDVVSICVPTPLSKSRDPDVSYIVAAGPSEEPPST